MDEHLARDKIVEFVRTGARGQDILDIRKHLDSPNWAELTVLLDKMVTAGLIKKGERRVEGNRLATFYQSDFPKGRRESWSRQNQPA